MTATSVIGAPAAGASDYPVWGDLAAVRGDTIATGFGQIAAQMSRAGVGNIAMRLLINTKNTDSLPNAEGACAELGKQANLISVHTIQDRNSAQALTDQIAVAAGVQARVGSGVTLDAGEIRPPGWARPTSEYNGSVYGWGMQNSSSFQNAANIGANCGQNIYAGSSGTVICVAGAECIIVGHGNGVKSEYTHIIDDGILVSVGQQVVVGRNIARAGAPGNSADAHLHYKVCQDEVAVGARTPMSGRGIQIA